MRSPNQRSRARTSERGAVSLLAGCVQGGGGTGALALDMAAATTLVLHRAGVDIVDDLGFDTADERFFSHRVRGDGGRQVTAARLVTA